jgi:hypothetical protein
VFLIHREEFQQDISLEKKDDLSVEGSARIKMH